ncbi:unnamed protein product, partial [Mesorhabditis spiculigera]
MLWLALVFCASIVDSCRDGIDNVFTIDSYGDDLPVHVKNVVIRAYDIFYKPSCYEGKVNIKMPGYFHIMGGEVLVPQNYDLFHHTMVRATVHVGEKHICDDGEGGMFFIPNKLCRFKMTTFVPPEICRVLQRKGTHTLEELWREAGFNSTQELPPAPSFLGVSLIDLLKGDYKIKVELRIHGEPIVRIAIPTDMQPMQWGL